ncbi:CBS domain-containing protein [Candidatus Bathyarchaeota archaeon]|jgi:signal-transduction protein with cAMP-binding, CBS, and nucleotidyltransferase domain|nr:CBS domain-containing protein [Candidatus Bathyarchaeota archaeon]
MTSKVLVKDLMSTNVNVFENESTMDKVVQAMSDCDVDYVIVVQSRRPTGIITERDVIVRMLTQGLDPSVVIARAVYTNPLVTIEETASAREAADLMNQWKIKHLPVTCDGRITGMLNYLDIVFNVPELMPAMKDLYKPSK